MTRIPLFLITTLMLTAIGCGDTTTPNATDAKRQAAQKDDSKNGKIDVCRCLSEPGNSPYVKQNEKECDKAISKKLGVPDWQKENLQNAAFKKKWANLEKECGSTKTDCIEKEKKARGCTAATIKDPNWDSQNCAKALVDALKACE